MEFDPQAWMQFGVAGLGFGWLLWWTTTQLKQSLDRNTEAIGRLARQVEANTLLLARITGQDTAELDRLLANGHGR